MTVAKNSIEAFIASLPKASESVEEKLLLKMRQSEAIAPAVASLAQRGYLGCLPFAHTKADEIVLRLLPNHKLSEYPVAIAWWDFTEGMTIASDLDHFVAGRLAQMDITTEAPLSSRETRDLVEFAADFGDQNFTPQMLGAIETILATDTDDSHCAALWAVADPDDELCSVLKAAWTLWGTDLNEWVSKAIDDIPNSEIVWRLYVSSHIMHGTGHDVSEPALKLLNCNNVFDSTYLGLIPGPSFQCWDMEALVEAVKWLQNNNPEVAERSPEIWKAARSYARNPLDYDGKDHLSAAEALAQTDSELAYIHASNAAAFRVRATGKTPVNEINLAHELAGVNHWNDLQLALEWTKAELGL